VRDFARLYAARRPLKDVLPDDFGGLDPEAYVPPDGAIGTGIDFRAARQLALLESWRGRHEGLYQALRADPQLNTLELGRPYIHNGQYPTPDAEIYAAMIAERTPRLIVEIGAGFSTIVARRTIDRLELESRLVVVDPQPRTDVAEIADEVLLERVEDADLGRLSFGTDTLLFVDSSHVVRSGGDVPLIFCRLIPALPRGVLVHVHDVFLPFDYPEAYRRRLYGEAYVLWALLADSPRYRVLLATHQMTRTQPQLMRELFGAIVGADERYYGASFWFEVVTDPAESG
jgi:Methyltransferase domain